MRIDFGRIYVNISVFCLGMDIVCMFFLDSIIAGAK
jgi:hypothetical protein